MHLSLIEKNLNFNCFDCSQEKNLNFTTTIKLAEELD